MTKFEIRIKFETRMTNDETANLLSFRHSNFVIRH